MKVIDKVRRIQREADFEEAKAIDLAAGPSTVIAARREQRVLLEALRRLPIDTQLLLELHYWEDMDIAELAKIFDAPSATWAVRVRSDYEPTALMFYFDDDGRMVRSVNEFGSRTEYSSLGEVREHCSDVRDLVRRMESLSQSRR